jgi:transcriptional regulator with XRE-family HTH domain
MIGKRLKEERIRLGLTQEKIMELAGVSKPTVISWEKGNSTLNANVLAILSQNGFDVLYIVTGTRTGDPKLKPDEAALLDNYRHSSEEGRQAIQATSDLLSQQQQSRKKGKAA